MNKFLIVDGLSIGTKLAADGGIPALKFIFDKMIFNAI
jgi:hypothetical protein